MPKDDLASPPPDADDVGEFVIIVFGKEMSNFGADCIIGNAIFGKLTVDSGASSVASFDAVTRTELVTLFLILLICFEWCCCWCFCKSECNSTGSVYSDSDVAANGCFAVIL